MDARADALGRLDSAGIPYFVTGSEALALWGFGYRQTNDMDVVVDLAVDAYERVLRPAFEPDYLVNDLVRTVRRWQGAVIHTREIVKVDLVIRDEDPWGREAFGRRVRVDDSALGWVWVSTSEDLLLAKLEWTALDQSELQLRDIRQILRFAPALDLAYVERHVAALGLVALWTEVARDS